MPTIEKRILSATSLRAMSQGDEMSLVGYAARFNVLSHPLPQGFREKIQPGAFRRSLDNGDDVVCTFNHDVDKVLGRRKSGTLTLAEDSKGLAFRCQLDPNQSSHRDIHAAVKRGDISDCSFAFSVDDGGDDFTDSWVSGKNCPVRTLRSVKLMDVSVVTHPAYPQTNVDARAAGAAVVVSPKANIAYVRRLFHKYPELDLETIGRALRLNYSEDFINELRLAAITREIAATGGYGVRQNLGQDSDPTQSLRKGKHRKGLFNLGDTNMSDDDNDDDFDFDNADDWDQDEHERCAEYHRQLSSAAPDMDGVTKHRKAADAHLLAASTGSAIDSTNARIASRTALGIYES